MTGGVQDAYILSNSDAFAKEQPAMLVASAEHFRWKTSSSSDLTESCISSAVIPDQAISWGWTEYKAKFITRLSRACAVVDYCLYSLVGHHSPVGRVLKCCHSLLHHIFALPKVLHTLRTISPVSSHPTSRTSMSSSGLFWGRLPTLTLPMTTSPGPNHLSCVIGETGDQQHNPAGTICLSFLGCRLLRDHQSTPSFRSMKGCPAPIRPMMMTWKPGVRNMRNHCHPPQHHLARRSVIFPG